VLDGRQVIYRDPEAGSPDLLKLDFTLGPWHTAVEEGASAPGQWIQDRVDGTRKAVVYGGSDSSVEVSYWVDAERHMRPSNLTAADGGAPMYELKFGYEGSAVHPSLVMEWNWMAEGQVEVTIWMIDRWVDVADDKLDGRTPPAHLAVHPQAEQPAELIEHPILVDLQEPERFAQALVYVLSKVGTTDAGADLAMDWRVDTADVDRLFSLYLGQALQ